MYFNRKIFIHIPSASIKAGTLQIIRPWKTEQEVFQIGLTVESILTRLHSCLILTEVSVNYCLDLQSNSVVTNSTGPSVFDRYIRDIVITVKVYVVN